MRGDDDLASDSNAEDGTKDMGWKCFLEAKFTGFGHLFHIYILGKMQSESQVTLRFLLEYVGVNQQTEGMEFGKTVPS